MCNKLQIVTKDLSIPTEKILGANRKDGYHVAGQVLYTAFRYWSYSLSLERSATVLVPRPWGVRTRREHTGGNEVH